MIHEGMISSFVFLLVAIALYLFYINQAINVKPPKIRRVPGLDAMEECIKRAVEMGRPVFYSTGVGRLRGGDMAMTAAGLTLLGHAANISADLDASFKYFAAVPTIVPIAEDMIRTAYQEKFRPEQIQFVPNQIALMATTLGEFEREKPGASFLLGALYWETVVIAEAGATVGAMQVGGTGRLYQVPYCVALCDYSLIGEELMAAGAYISQDPAQLGTIMASDILRIIIVGMAAVLAIAGLAGYDLSNLISL